MPSYMRRIMVLGKTRLKEADLILTCLAQDGSQIRCVAKGARKPTSTMSSRLEIFAVADAMIAQGRSLDTVTEARAVDLHRALREDAEAVMAALPLAELLARTTHEDLPVENLFAMAQAALEAFEKAEASSYSALCAAALLKTVAMMGFRPHLSSCVLCGLDRRSFDDAPSLAFSYGDGGILCSFCARSLMRTMIPASTLDLAQTLLMSTFGDLAQAQYPAAYVDAVVQFAHTYLRENMGIGLKAMAYRDSFAG